MEIRTITDYLKQDPDWAKILTDMEITEDWLRSVGFEEISFSRNAIAVDMDGTYLCIDEDGLAVSLYDELDDVCVHIRPLNTQEEVRQLYKLLSEEEL